MAQILLKEAPLSLANITVFDGTFDPKECVVGQLTAISGWDELRDVVLKHAWSAAVFVNGHRSNKNFEKCELIALDVDDGCSLEEARLKFAGYQYLIHTTKSHQRSKGAKPPCDRFRVILRLERPITSQREYEYTWQYLRHHFPFIDKACPDPARFFFPGTGASVNINTVGRTVSIVNTLSRKTREFLAQGAEGGEWNHALFLAAKDLQQQQYTEAQAIEILEEPTRLEGNLGCLDEQDLVTIASAYKKAPKYPPRGLLFNFGDGDGDSGSVNYEALAREVIEPYFLQAVTDEETFVYRISDPMMAEVVACNNEMVLVRHVQEELNSLQLVTPDGEPVKLPSAQKLIHFWRVSGSALPDEPRTFDWLDSEYWTFRRIPFVPVAGEYGAWEEFLARLSDREAFMAYVWSCFEMKNRSRQALYLFGERGQDGKSTVLRVLSSLFGNAASSISNIQMQNGSRFLMSSFYNKRLVVYPDVKNTRFLMTEVFRALTSHDPVQIEFKGRNPISRVLEVKLMLASNSEPSITHSQADMSRLLRIDVSPTESIDDPLWEDRLIEELPYFLDACRAQYKDRCRNHGQIVGNEYTKYLIEEAADEFQEPQQHVFEKVLEYIPGETGVEATELYKRLKDNGLSNYEIGDFKEFLRTRYRVKKRRLSGDDGIRKHYYTDLKFKSLVNFKILGGGNDEG